MRLQLFIWSTIINAIFSFAMVALVLFSRPLTKVKIYWAAMCAAVGIWSLGLSWMSSINDFQNSLIGSAIVTGASIFIPTFLFHTVHSLLKKTEKLPLFLIYGYSLFLSILNLRGMLMTVTPALEFPYYTHAKPLYSLFMIHLYFGFSVVEFILWKAARSAPPLQRKQLMSLFWGAGLGFLGGQMTVPLVYEIPLFPYGVFFVPVYILFVGHSMLKYQFMDFRLALRKLGLTIAIYLILILVMAPIGWPLIRSILNQPQSVFNQILALSAMVTILLATGPVIYALVLHRTYWLRGHTTMALTHELKSPLANIRGAIECLSVRIPQLSGDTQAIQDYRDMLDRNTDRLEHFVDDLLSIAAIQEGEITLDYKEFSLLETAQAVADQFAPIASQKGIQILLTAPDKMDIYGDQAKIEQVISNLVSNAVKYSKNGTIEIKMSAQDTQLTCSVSDQGEGIAPKDLDRIFDRFYQGQGYRKGSGIGLAIAKAWVNAHHGKIWAESAGIGKGTTVTFTLPHL